MGHVVPPNLVPRRILVDTSAYFALADRTDRHHSSAVSFVRSNEVPLVTTDLIVVTVGALSFPNPSGETLLLGATL